MKANIYIDGRALGKDPELINLQGSTRDITAEEILELFNRGFDVMITHTTTQHATRKKPRVEGVPVVMVDEFGGRFKVR